MTYHRPNHDDCRELAAVMRFEDVREVACVGGLTPYEALKQSVDNSDDPCVAYNGPIPICMWGVGRSAALGVGHPWLLGSPEIESFSIRFLRESREWVARMEERYSVLTNLVDERNTVHLKWLRWLGFSFTHRYPEVGPARIPVLQFSKVSSACASTSSPPELGSPSQAPQPRSPDSRLTRAP